ncbi:MAG: thiol peroxidase [Bacteroidetes bacterium]|nr:thiol peroxidase [Bacteroidota bacterium]
MQASLDSVLLNGKRIQLHDELPVIGTTAEDFTFVKPDLSEDSFYDIEGVRVILALPSLDTGTCSKMTRMFNEELSKREGVTGIVVSKDLPFAMRRFCETNGIKNIVAASDYRYNEFTEEYNIKMLEGALKGLIARAVLVVDKKGKIRYTELVEDVVNEPDYQAALEAVDKLLAS